MDRVESQVLDILSENGFELVRERKHRVFKNPGGKIWVLPKTASDTRALNNNLADLKRFLSQDAEVGGVRETPGIPAQESIRGQHRLQRQLVPEPQESVAPQPRALGIAADKYFRMHKLQPQPQTQRTTTTKRFTLLDPYQVNVCLRREMLRSFNQFRLGPEDDPDWGRITSEDRQAIAEVGMDHLPDSELIRRKQCFWLERFREHNVRLERARHIATKTTQQTVKNLRRYLVVRITSTFIERRQLRPEAEAKLALEFAAYLLKAFTPIFEETPAIVKPLINTTLYHWTLCMQLALAYALRFEANGIVVSTFHGRGPDEVAAD